MLLIAYSVTALVCFLGFCLCARAGIVETDETAKLALVCFGCALLWPATLLVILGITIIEGRGDGIS